MPETELAWAAGFFDGEGSCFVCHSGKKGGKYLPYPQVSISQSGKLGGEILTRFANAVGDIGKLYGPKPPAKNQKLVRWLWEASGYKKTLSVYETLKPYLSSVKIVQFERNIKLYLQARGK